MILFKKISAIVLSIAIGGLFIYSGFTKLWPLIETFEFTFVDIHVANWYTAPVFARIMIGIEFITGLLLLMNFRLRKFTLPLTIALLVFFTIYLSVIIIVSGNSGNCGCFGEHHSMTPLQAILKNIIMLLAVILVWKWEEGWSLKNNKLFISLMSTTCLLVPFLINPIDYNYTSNNMDEEINYPLDLNLLYQPEDTSKVAIPKTDLRKGKQVVAFLSLTCSHCRIAAKKFYLIKKNNPKLPVYFILNGDKKDYTDFINDTKADNIPSSYCLGKSFVLLASAHLPRIYYLDNGIVVKKVDYFELNQYDIENWLAK